MDAYIHLELVALKLGAKKKYIYIYYILCVCVRLSVCVLCQKIHTKQPVHYATRH